MRIFRFVKILRVARLQRLKKRWEERVPFKQSTITIFTTVLGLIMSSHWGGCILALEASLHQTAGETWLGSHAYGICHLPRTDILGFIRPGQGLSVNMTLPDYVMDQEAFGDSWATGCHDMSVGVYYIAAVSLRGRLI